MTNLPLWVVVHLTRTAKKTTVKVTGPFSLLRWNRSFSENPNNPSAEYEARALIDERAAFEFGPVREQRSFTVTVKTWSARAHVPFAAECSAPKTYERISIHRLSGRVHLTPSRREETP